MITMLVFSAAIVFAAFNVMACSCRLIAGLTDSRLDESPFTPESESNEM